MEDRCLGFSGKGLLEDSERLGNLRQRPLKFERSLIFEHLALELRNRSERHDGAPRCEIGLAVLASLGGEEGSFEEATFDGG